MRFSEMVLQHFSQISEKTKYSAVRFGNVVESQGSVIPLFKKQIEAGGPVTVTHPEITRYFMTIPEAVSLVLEASADASGREIYMLDMGKPVKIYALAIDMIKSYGLRPDKDIKIVFTGLRPGEKLYEELLLSNAGIDETSNEKISKMAMKEYPQFMEKYNELIRHAQENNKEDVTNCLKAFVQSFRV